MKIVNLTEGSKIYTSNVYLVLGEWNAIEDVNTLIDVGSDEVIFEKINKINTGLGKRKIDQVILTHNHSDHTSMLKRVIETYKPRVLAFNNYLKGVDYVLKDKDIVKMGEAFFEVIHVTIHSSDSICLYNSTKGVLFVGDTPVPHNLRIQDTRYEYPQRFINAIPNIKVVFFGHGESKKFT